jgi:hypothetical protein
MREERTLEEKKGRNLPKRILDMINPLRDPSLIVAIVLTFIEEAGQPFTWYIIILVALVNWLAVRGVMWLVVNFIFAATFLGRRLWWAIKNPQLAWRLLDAVGHEEIVIGGLPPSYMENVILQDGTTLMAPQLGASGIHVIGELPAGTEVPIMSMNGQTDMSGFFPGMVDNNPFATNNGFMGQQAMSYQPSVDAISAQDTGELRSYSQRSSQQEERLRQQLAAYQRLLEDWMQFTEEKWRTVSDSQLGWKPLRGRWGSWDDIFNDAYAAKTSDPMAQAAQTAGEATARRFDFSREKGSAASAVACFIRDMMTLRNGVDLLQQNGDYLAETSAPRPAVQTPFSRRSGGLGSQGNSGPLSGNSSPGSRSSLFRRPAQIFVDADTTNK